MDQNQKDNESAAETNSVNMGGNFQINKETVPNQLGEFKLILEVGAGGMATVYKAFDLELKRQVALKILHPALGLSDSSQHRFLREAWIAGRVQHPNIITVYSRGQALSYNYIAMEYAEGGSLRERIHQSKLRIESGESIKDIAGIDYIRAMVKEFADIADALDKVHADGYIHRDIKPHNILLCGEAQSLKLTDFGIAFAPDMTRMTKAGDFMGTVRYMSPEVIAAHRTPVDCRSDIYSLGVTLFEALTTQLPYQGETDEKVIGDIVAGRCRLARRLNPFIPRDLETVLCKAMHLDTKKRYQSAAELRDDLWRVLRNESVLAKREGLVRHTIRFVHRRRALLTFMLVTGLLTGVAITEYFQRREEVGNRERILNILRSAVRTRTTPSLLDAGWAPLSAVLLECIQSRCDDSLGIWYMRAYGQVALITQQYGKPDRVSFSIQTPKADIIPAGTGQERKRLALLIGDAQVRVDDNRYHSVGTFAYYYGTGKVISSGVDGTIKKLAPTLDEGLHSVHLRFIARHFYGGTGYVHAARVSKPDIPPLVVGTDTLSPCPSGYSLISMSLAPEEFLVLDPKSLRECAPALIDTVTDSSSVWIFAEYPDNFPELVRLPIHDTSPADYFQLDSITIVKTASGRYSVTVDGVNNTASLPLAIAGKIVFSAMDSGEEVLVASLRIDSNSFDIGFPHPDMSASRASDPDGSYFEIDRGLPDTLFLRLVKLGKKIVRAEFTPSQEVARMFGDVYQIWDESFSSVVTLQAFDSSIAGTQ